MTQFQSPAPPAAPTNEGGVGKVLGIISIICGGVGVCIPGLGFIGLLLGLIGLIVAQSGQRLLPGIGTGVSALSALISMVVMVAIMLPAFAAARDTANAAREMSNLRQIGVAYYSYATDNNGNFPHHAEEVTDYIIDPSVFIAPADADAGISLTKDEDSPTEEYTYGSFTFTPLAGYTMNDLDHMSVIAFSTNPRGPNNERIVLYLDGHVERHDQTTILQELKEHYENMPKKQPDGGGGF